MDIQTAKKIGAIILALLCSWVIAGYFSTAITRMMGLTGADLALVSFILYAVIFFIALSAIQKAFGVFIFDDSRLD